MKRNAKFFLLGSVFGVILFVLLIFVFGNVRNPVLTKLFGALFFPGVVVGPVDSILHWLAGLFNSNIDRGLGFDAGPLVWVEWFAWAVSMAVCYGLIFMLIAKIVIWFRQRNLK